MADERQREERDERSRAAVLAALAVVDRGTGKHCPEPERIVAWHDATVDDDESARIQTHVAHCEHCYALWTGLLRTGAPATPQPAALRWWQRLGFGAGARRRTGGILAGALAAGLAIVALVQFAPFGTAPIPDYELSIQGKARTRGVENPPAGDPVRLREGNRFSVVLRPDTAPGTTVAGLAFILDAAGLRDLPAPPPRVLDNGVIVFEGRVGEDVTLPAGASTLVFVGGRSDALPGRAEIRRKLDGSASVRTDDWAAWRVEVIRE